MIKPVLVLFFISVLASCYGSITVKNSYIDEDSEDQHVAKVYFIRTMPVKYKGIADSKIMVDLNGEKLFDIKEGSYTLVKLKPFKGTVTTHSRTMFTTKSEPISVTRTREYNFIAGKTYFINLKRVNEEFRGIYYDPEPINLETAKTLVRDMRAVGLATMEPIYYIEKVADTPAPSKLEPVLPENLYPGKPYLIKGNPKYVAPEQPEGKNEITFDKPPENTAPSEQK